MPQNKIQHYVPKCHLRQFCTNDAGQPDPSGSSINLYNIGADRLIPGAPIRGQCARPYFYGKDGELERALQGYEGLYSSIVKKLAVEPGEATASDLSALLSFCVLQTFRTFAFVEKIRQTEDRLQADLKEIAQGKEYPKTRFKQPVDAVILAINIFMKSHKYISDLESIILINKTTRQFITSDDPAILTNRYYFQKLRSEYFGMSASGAIYYMPLLPELALLAFDPNMYILHGRKKSSKTIFLRNVMDVNSLNDLQIINAKNNIYFSNYGMGELIQKRFHEIEKSRPKEWIVINYLEKTGNIEFAEVPENREMVEVREQYRSVPALPKIGKDGFLTALHLRRVKPQTWPRFLGYRLRPKVHETGTAAGVIRPTLPKA